MTFELELGEIHVWCSSPECTRKLVEKGARLVNPAQSEELRRILETAEPVTPSASGRKAPANGARV
jgi:acyl-coenzyme A synthetase/AMP-(fatty) acid ligase